MLRKLPTLFCVLLLSFFVSCDQGEEVIEEPAPLEDCVTRTSSVHGTTVNGRYIVSFAAVPITTGRSSASARVLTDLDIPSEKIVDEIAGDGRMNYVMDISSEQASMLKNHTSVLAIEPDRYLSIKACFSVLEPTLVTWNVDKVGYACRRHN
jgi:hypothetical protein